MNERCAEDQARGRTRAVLRNFRLSTQGTLRKGNSILLALCSTFPVIKTFGSRAKAHAVAGAFTNHFESSV